MFCTKCGSKLSEESVFCPQCGQKVAIQQGEDAKVLEDTGTSTQISQPEEPVGQSKTEPPLEDTAGLYALLEADAGTQPGIISVKQVKNVVSIRARANNYFVGINNRQALMTSSLTFPLSVLYMVPFGIVAYIASSISWDFMERSSLYFEDYALPFMLCLLTGGLSMAVTPLLGRKERESVTGYVREIAEPRGISLVTKKMKPAVRYLISAILILFGVLVLIFGVLEVELGSSGSGSAYVFDEGDSNDGYDLSNGESISLTQTYVNEEEGFSFMYPGDWKIENEEEVSSDTIISVACTGALGTYARIAVGKEVDYGFYFDAVSSDFEELFSDVDGLSNVKIMDLSDVALDGHQARKLTIAADNDIGVRITEIYYFYIQEPYVYYVIFAVEEADYDRYESKLNAIMDSYTITAQEQQEEWGGSTGGDLVYDGIEDYEGSWSGRDYDRIYMEINYVDANGGYFDISIGWSSSASEWTQWELRGVYTEEGVMQYYGNEIEYAGSYETGETEENVVSEAEEGVLWIGEDGLLYWDDYTESSGETYVLQKLVY